MSCLTVAAAGAQAAVREEYPPRAQDEALAACMKTLRLRGPEAYDGKGSFQFTDEKDRLLQDCMMQKGFFYGSLMAPEKTGESVAQEAPEKTPGVNDKAQPDQAFPEEAAPRRNIPVYVPRSTESSSRPVFLPY